MKVVIYQPARYPAGKASDIGPHVTIAYSEDLTGDVDDVLDAVEAAMGAAPAAAALTGSVEMFGPDQDVPVALLADEALATFRDAVLARLCEFGCAAPATWPEYRPHITLEQAAESVEVADVALGAPVVKVTNADGEALTFDFGVQAMAELTPEQRTPTKAMQQEAQAALDRREEATPSQRGGTPVGLARARDIAGGRALSMLSIKRSHNFCSRSGGFKSERGQQARGFWACKTGADWFKSRIEMAEGAEAAAEVQAAAESDGIGRPMIVLSEGVHTHMFTGRPVSRTVTAEHLAEMVRVFNTGLQNTVHLDWRHGTSPYVGEGKPDRPETGGSLGRVVAMRIVQRDGRVAIEATPRWNRRGLRVVDDHLSPDGSESDLRPSGEWLQDRPVFARDAHGNETSEQIGTAALLAVGMQPRQMHADGRVTPALMAETPPASGKGSTMTMIKRLLAQLGIPDEAAKDVLKALEEGGEDAAMAVLDRAKQAMAEAAAEPEVAMEPEEPETAAEPAAAGDYARAADVVAMSERVAKTQADLQAMQALAKDQAFKASGLVPADRKAWDAVYDTHGVQAAAEFAERHAPKPEPVRQVMPAPGVQAAAEKADPVQVMIDNAFTHMKAGHDLHASFTRSLKGVN